MSMASHLVRVTFEGALADGDGRFSPITFHIEVDGRDITPSCDSVIITAEAGVPTKLIISMPAAVTPGPSVSGS